MASIKEIWRRYQSGKATSKDKQELIKAIDNKDAELDRIFNADWGASKDFKTDPDEIQHAKKRLLEELGLTKKRKRAFHGYRIAASVLILIGLSLFLYLRNRDTIITIEAASGKTIEQVVLPDGSKVWINHGSSISYPKDFSPESRRLQLVGNAFFDVVRDPSKPFIIETRKLNVKVLGTSFDVYCYADEPSSVTVQTGKVEVSHPRSSAKIQLIKNERSVLDPESGTFQKVKTDSGMGIAWRNNVLQFENMELGQVLKNVERKYGVKINCPDTLLLKSRIRAHYKNEPLDTVLSDLAFMTNFAYSKNEKTNEITLKPNPYEKIE